ncbi:hypothetical protein [Gimesia fumaroli]|uniref:hypothetical protein n=1 Tax=Gimesia fumaroli TaxID=2527976 RepID=UPI0018D84272|nr:hypothetical protein [Gimesia fumaroli]
METQDPTHGRANVGLPNSVLRKAPSPCRKTNPHKPTQTKSYHKPPATPQMNTPHQA